MKSPSEKDIKSALDHGLWLRNQVCTGEGRMLADLAWAYSNIQSPAVALGSIKSAKKAKSSRANGKLGGRPPSA